MSRNHPFPPKLNNLRVLLNCFYAYLISSTFQYTKQVLFHSSDSIYLKIYLFTRSLISTVCICLYSILIIYSLWLESVQILSISLLLLSILFVVRFISDLYYSNLDNYTPALFMNINATQINSTLIQSKQLQEEITDLTMELITNLTGVLLTMFIVIRMLKSKRARKQMEVEALGIDPLRRMTV
ncbi:unnamed protein product [Adineta ricciae]|uniref:Uncharacterized protein n=1 Tax=Adineta ricciae TaxID=249248 RepID=A0A815C041_ADIRI|nr:unnamed protein product [Adineta ricciae]